MDVPSYMLGKKAGGGSITETDPIFSASAASGITSSDINSWNAKQSALVSGTNIKTINNESILGQGNINIQGGSSLPVYVIDDNSEQNPFILSENDPGLYFFTNIEVVGIGGIVVYIKVNASSTGTDTVILSPGLPMFAYTKKIQDVSDYENFIFYGDYMYDESGKMVYRKTSKTPWGITNDFGNASLFSDLDINSLLRNVSGYDASKTQVLKNVGGSFTWVDE